MQDYHRLFLASQERYDKLVNLASSGGGSSIKVGGPRMSRWVVPVSRWVVQGGGSLELVSRWANLVCQIGWSLYQGGWSMCQGGWSLYQGGWSLYVMLGGPLVLSSRWVVPVATQFLASQWVVLVTITDLSTSPSPWFSS